MDLFSGYSDSSNNPFSGLQNAYGSQAQSNDFLSGLNRQITGPQYDPFAQSGGFGALTDIYSGAGAAYGRATGGFGGTVNANSFGVDPGTWSTMSPGDQQTFNRTMGGGIGSDAGQSPGQYQNQDPVVDWNKYFNTTTSDYPAAPAAEPSSPGSNSQTPSGWSPTPGGNPDMQRLLGYTPQNLYSGGGIGSDAARAPSQPDIFSGMSAGDKATWQRTMEAAGQGDAARNALAQQMVGMTPANGPYPNLGYNPGFGGDFAAGGGMQQYNPQQMTNDLQRTLGNIGGGGQSYQQLGMSPSDWNTFSGIVGQDAANAWLQKGSQ
jgi:hypothetical protein